MPDAAGGRAHDGPSAFPLARMPGRATRERR